MPKLPHISGRQARRALERLGWIYKHHTGSHMVFDKPGQEYTICVPDHKELHPGIMRAIVRMSGAGLDEFTRSMKQ